MKNKTILAIGADMKNRSLLAKAGRICFSLDTGDLSDAGNYGSFKKKVLRLVKNEKARPGTIAYDLHPGYFSTKFAREFGADLKLKNMVPVQHHHAHIASVMYEYGLEGPVIGVSFDGTGYGTDGNIWGGEFLVVDKKGFTRAGHLKYRMMPGGDKAVLEPWRMVLSILGEKGAPFLKDVPRQEKELVLTMMSKGLNSPLTSSAGRLFDAAAALLGICVRAKHEAEGPIRLESMCKDDVEGHYGFEIEKENRCFVIDTDELFTGMTRDMRKEQDTGIIASKFHNSMCRLIVETVRKISKSTGIKDVALSGGVFQNRYLTPRIQKGLIGLNHKTFVNRSLPANDLNIALGQYFAVSGGHGDRGVRC
jgi:hydrogenase maturation protein HypF